VSGTARRKCHREFRAEEEEEEEEEVEGLIYSVSVRECGF
jgi:hypothetical protein